MKLENMIASKKPHSSKPYSASFLWVPAQIPSSPVEIIAEFSPIRSPRVSSVEIDDGIRKNYASRNTQNKINPSFGVCQRIHDNDVGSFNSSDEFQTSTPSSKSIKTLSLADLMTVEQTAKWIWKFGRISGWDEADLYAESFDRNHIRGRHLPELTLDSLKFDLGIMNYQHRLEILSAINRMHYGISIWDYEFGADDYHEKRKPTVHSLNNDPEIPSISSAMLKQQRSKFSPYKSAPKEGKRLRNAKTILNINLPHKTKALSTRARPGNPIKYKTLHSVEVRAGKSVRTRHVGYLHKGSIVVINQVKGRSGRVVLQQANGEYVKVGWVTLYTYKRQLLRKYDHKKFRS